jgi:hypothetical protein
MTTALLEYFFNSLEEGATENNLSVTPESWLTPKVHETEIVVHYHALMHQVVRRSFSQTQSFREGHSTFRWSQSLLRLPFTATDCR